MLGPPICGNAHNMSRISMDPCKDQLSCRQGLSLIWAPTNQRRHTHIDDTKKYSTLPQVKMEANAEDSSLMRGPSPLPYSFEGVYATGWWQSKQHHQASKHSETLDFP